MKQLKIKHFQKKNKPKNLKNAHWKIIEQNIKFLLDKICHCLSNIHQPF